MNFLCLRKSWQQKGCSKIPLEGWRGKSCAEKAYWKYWNAAGQLVLLFSRALPIFNWDAGRSRVEARWGTEPRERTAGGSNGEEAQSPCLLVHNSVEQSMAEGWTWILLSVGVVLSHLSALTGEYQLSGKILSWKLCLQSHSWVWKLLLYFGAVLRHTSSLNQVSPSYPTCFNSGVVLHICNI